MRICKSGVVETKIYVFSRYNPVWFYYNYNKRDYIITNDGIKQFKNFTIFI